MLTRADMIIVAAYLAATLALGLASSARGASVGEYFLASRRASWPMIGLALVASNISPGALIGMTGSAYALGISVYDYDWMAALVLLIFALAFLPKLLAARIYTIPEYFERRYDRRARVWLASLSILLYVLLDAAGTLYCGTLLLRAVDPGASFTGATLILAGLAALYAATGGLRSVMRTQALQAVVLLAASLGLAATCFVRAGGWRAIVQAVPPSHLSLIRPVADPYMPWTGLVLGAPVMAFYYWCTNQVMVQKTLAARGVADGQRGALFAGFLKLLTLFVIVLPGVAGRVLFPDLAQGDRIYLRLALGLLPPGLLGLLVAAFLGALLSSLSATYQSAATVISIDLIRRARPAMSERDAVRWARIATIGCLLASVAWAPEILKFPSLWQYFQEVLAYATPPLAALFLAGLLWPRANARGAFAALVAGGGLAAVLLALSGLGLAHVQFLHAAALLFAFSLATLIAFSLPGSRAAAGAERASVARSMRAAWTSLPVDVRWAAIALLAATATIVIEFW